MYRKFIVLIISHCLLQTAIADEKSKGLEKIVPGQAFSISYTYRPNGQGQPKPLINGSILHSGDHYKLTFTPPAKSYVYVLQNDSVKVDCLFPMADFKGVIVNNYNPVDGDKTYVIPAEDKFFKLDRQTGTESIYFITAPAPDAFLEEFCLHTKTQPSIAQVDIHIKYRDPIDIVPNSQETASVTYGEETFNILQNYLTCRQETGCKHIITFEHR